MIFIDFEYNNTAEKNYNLVCCSMLVEGRPFDFWLHNDESAKYRLKKFLEYRKGETFVSWASPAEAGSFLSLGLNPLDFRWIDLQLEYKMLVNHWDEYRYGKQLINGRKVFTKNMGRKDLMTPEELEEAKGNDPELSLVAACYKLLDIELDTDNKKNMRDLILSNPPSFTEEEKKLIVEYCQSDIKHMPQLLQKMMTIYDSRKYLGNSVVEPEHVYSRGRTGAICACITQIGYPVEPDWLDNLSHNIPLLLKELAENINGQLEEPLFTWSKREQRYKKEMAVIQKAISKSVYADEWQRTATGKYSTSSEIFEKHYSNFKHGFPEGNVIAQYMRYMAAGTALNSLRPNKDRKKTIQNVIGADGRCRAWLNPYGSQTGRFQPPATQYLFLKSAWMRSLCVPKEGNVIISMDYASQEFLLSAVISEDDEMFKSYMAGDVYLAFGKSIGLIPSDGTKDTHKLERNMCKAAVLGLSYGMGPDKLAKKIADDTNTKKDIEAGRKFRDDFYSLYSDYKRYREWIMNFYEANGFLQAIDGWVLWGDNPSRTSIMNFPIQSAGSAILRRALDLCLQRGLKVIAPLHDAIYIECEKESYLESMKILYQCMKEAAPYWFQSQEQKQRAECIRLDASVWGPGLEEKDGLKTEYGLGYSTQEIYIDERGQKEFKAYEKYLKEKL